MSEDVKREPTLEDNEVPALAISMKGIVGSGKDGTELAMATHVAGDLPKEEINKMMDKMTYCLNRQRVVGDIPFLLEQIEYCEKSIDNITENIVQSDRSLADQWAKGEKHGKVRLKKADADRRNQQLHDINRTQKDLDAYKAKLKVAEGLLGETGEVEQGKAVKSA